MTKPMRGCDSDPPQALLDLATKLTNNLDLRQIEHPIFYAFHDDGRQFVVDLSELIQDHGLTPDMFRSQVIAVCKHPNTQAIAFVSSAKRIEAPSKVVEEVTGLDFSTIEDLRRFFSYCQEHDIPVEIKKAIQIGYEDRCGKIFAAHTAFHDLGGGCQFFDDWQFCQLTPEPGTGGTFQCMFYKAGVIDFPTPPGTS